MGTGQVSDTSHNHRHIGNSFKLDDQYESISLSSGLDRARLRPRTRHFRRSLPKKKGKKEGEPSLLGV